MTLASDSGAQDARSFKVIGTRPIRHDGMEKVTGQAKYGADVQMTGLLHGKMLRSPHAHARIVSIDCSKAQALPGVRAIATARDFAISADAPMDLSLSQGGARLLAENDLARDKVMYKGHAIAAIAATSPHIAQEAVSLIDVEYEELPAVFDVRSAMSDDAPVLHEGLTTMFKLTRFEAGEDTGQKGNIASHIQHERGDLDKGFEEADIVVEREFNTSMVHQGYIEPFASTAHWQADGHLTIWTSTQGAWGIRANTAAILGIPETQIKVINMEVGGGFGGKGTGYLDPVAAVLSKKSGHPVRIVMDRKEVFEGTGPTSGTYMRCKMGVTNDGKITAGELYMAFEAGAFPGSPVAGGAGTGFGPYKMDNLSVNGYDVVLNKPKTAAYRAPGNPQAAFAVESVVDELAEKLNMGPMEFRLLNAVNEGDRAPNGLLHARFGCVEVEEAMKAHDHHNTPLTGPNQGRGMAVGYRLNVGGSGSSATIVVNANGTINMITGSADLSGTRTSLAMQAAETLGITVDDVTPSVTDTDSIGFTGGSGGSRTTFDTGRAVIKAAEDVIQQMSERAALLWDVQPEDVEFLDGVFICTSNEENRATFKEMAGRLMETGGPLTCSASDRQGGVGAQLAGNMVDVEVDPETGKVEILRYTTFLDAGTAAHPAYVEGQMQGAALQGIGWALNEEYHFNDEGTMANSSFLDYRMPTSLDLPMIDTVIIEVPNPRHPYGLRGVGETPIIPPMAALANAIHDATGVRMSELPMSPHAILRTIQEQSSED
ncbi:MAG: xanthine dehydrogenase family protein molybdopterin-binding subunit [SAR202 cluster bacterium]|nr:xanthine dehydrogenase family protein molybdopterin-binding subunit [SAR202 cluster bacterium]